MASLIDDAKQIGTDAKEKVEAVAIAKETVKAAETVMSVASDVKTVEKHTQEQVRAAIRGVFARIVYFGAGAAVALILDHIL